MKKLVSTLILSQLVLACSTSGSKKNNTAGTDNEKTPTLGIVDEGEETDSEGAETKPDDTPVVPDGTKEDLVDEVIPTEVIPAEGVPAEAIPVEVVTLPFVIATGKPKYLDLSTFLKEHYSSPFNTSEYKVSAFFMKNNSRASLKDKKLFLPGSFTGSIAIELLYAENGLGMKGLKNIIVTSEENKYVALETALFARNTDSTHYIDKYMESAEKLGDKTQGYLIRYYELVGLYLNAEVDYDRATKFGVDNIKKGQAWYNHVKNHVANNKSPTASGLTKLKEGVASADRQ
ncbi:MAG: hypothetical protein EOP04_24830 [Proteobacteria bacterium]|nr:MAG: hypothetical protein EOP04_24830 [Pseudomonadota bacterium]